jgi:prepilin-type N-terminal cleavage/methylation domain-containing protein
LFSLASFKFFKQSSFLLLTLWQQYPTVFFMLNNRLLSRAARVLNRGGFTLVELLVVIGIIAILAGVALGPITNGIKKAKQSGGLQSAHALGLAMYSAANDDSQVYPDLSGGSAAPVAGALLAGGYVTDPSIFFLSGDTNSAAKYGGVVASAATSIQQSNISWDFISNAGVAPGVNTTSYPFLPLMWSTVATGTEPAFSTTATTITATPASVNPFQTAGVAVFYINNSAAFVSSTVAGSALTCTLVTSVNNPGSAAYSVNAGK